MKGVVKFYNDTKGFGFIGIDGRGDVFVHFTAIKNAPAGEKKKLVQGQRVEFDIETVDGRERATRVAILS